MEEKEIKQVSKYDVLKIVVVLLILIGVWVSAWYSYQTNVLMNMAIRGERPASSNRIVISEKYDKGQSLDNAIASGKPIVAFFYADWCGASQKMAPIFAKLTKNREFKKNFAVAYINAELLENAKYLEEYKIQWFPTVYVINPEKRTKKMIDNAEFYSTKTVKDLIQDFIGYAN